MDTFIISPLIQSLQTLPAEGVSVILFFVCTLCMLILFRTMGVQGLFLYNIVAVLASNIQVLREVKFALSAKPVALGTVVFATTYLCSDIITEHFGKKMAHKGVWYCFAAQILMTLMMTLAVGYPEILSQQVGSQPSHIPAHIPAHIQHIIDTEKALALLFTPSLRILCASLIAFAISQYNDIAVFHAIHHLTRGRWLWLRTSASAIISAIIDTVLFSVLAFVVLSPEPVSWSTLFFTYILGTCVTRAIMSLFTTPIMYLSYATLPRTLKTV